MSRPAKPLGVMTDTQQQLVVDNLGLVRYTIDRYFPKYHFDDDIVSCANLALCVAALNWDESKAKFSSYAIVCIRNAIRNEFRDRSKRIPTISLDTPIGEEKMTLEDVIPDEDDTPHIPDYSFVHKLSPSERVVYDLRQEGYSVEEIEKLTDFNHRKVMRLLRFIKAKYHKYTR